MADFSASLGDDLVIDPWPADMSGFVQTSMLYLNANTTGENTGAVKSFIAYLLEEESQTIFYEADETFLPANTRVEVPDPLRQQALAALEGGVSWIVIPEMGAYWGPTENAIRRALQTDADLAAVLAETEQIVIEAVAEIRAVE
jgi:ABC-type glycerol-3-phosphate transport system substrate-binding protein